MSTRASRLIEETLRRWDDSAPIEDDDGLEYVMADIEAQLTGEMNAAYSAEAAALIMGPGYTVVSEWDTAESRRQ